MITPALILVLASLGGAAQRAQCGCHPAASGEVPIAGNESVVQIVRAPVRSIRGNVFLWDGETPAEKAIVEVFRDVGEATLSARGRRLASCVTGPDGKFRLPRLRAGKYVLRVGFGRPGFNNTHVVVRVATAARRASGKEISVEILLAT